MTEYYSRHQPACSLCFCHSYPSRRTPKILGQRIMGFSIGQTRPGDDFVKEVDNAILDIGVGVRLPVNEHVDGLLSLGYSKLDGSYDGVKIEGTGKSIIGGFDYHFTPQMPVNPFIGARVGLVSTEFKYSFMGERETEDLDDFTFAVGGGVQVMLSDVASLTPSIAYQRIDNFDYYIGSVGLAIWLNDSFLAGVSVGYEFDDGDVSYAFSVGVGF